MSSPLPRAPSSARCPGARKGLRFYRAAANASRLERDVAQYPIGHAAESGSCAFVKWAADLWRKRAREERHLTRRWRRAMRDPAAAIRHVFGRHAGIALKVAWCESGLRPYAVSRTNDVGVFQINYATHHRSGESFEQFKRRFFDVMANVRYAFRLSRGGRSWGPWLWSRRCWAR